MANAAISMRPQVPQNGGGTGYNPYANYPTDPFNSTNPWSQYYGMPQAPQYSKGFDPSTMSMSDYLGTVYDPSGFNAYKEQAMRKGPSAWATLATQDQALQAKKMRDQGASQANAQTAQAEDDLSARGGLSSGARERATIEGSKNYLSMAQSAGQTENLNDMQIGMNDEQNRIQQLSALPGMEQQQAGMFESAKNNDIQNAIQENNRVNQYNQTLYGQQMDAWAANRQAEATQNSGKK